MSRDIPNHIRLFRDNCELTREELGRRLGAARGALRRTSMKNLRGRVAVVTGGAGGIGLGMAHAFADAGMHLVLADIDEARLNETVTTLNESGATTIAVPTDVSNRTSVEELASRTIERFGGVHLVCNNAGSPLPKSLSEITAEDWIQALSVNLFGVVNGIQVFLPIMEEQGEGHINATSSMSGLIACPPVVGYNVAKFGVIAVMESLARELRMTQSPVGVSVFCPGEVATHAIDNAVRNARMGGYEPTGEELASIKIAQAGLLNSGMDPDEVGRIVLEGLTQGRFWIFSHPDWVAGPIRDRFEAMAADGSLPDF